MDSNCKEAVPGYPRRSTERTLGGGPRLPERLWHGPAQVRRSREDEEEVGEPVQVDRHQGIQLDLLGSVEHGALRPPADGPRDVDARRGLGSAGKHEALQLLELGVEPVTVDLERIDLRLRHPQAAIPHAERHADVGADVEQLVLDALEDGSDLRQDVAGERDADQRVELVDRPEGADPAVELGHAAAVAEARLAAVAAARVDPRQPNRLVSLARHSAPAP